jgi:leucyl aminopeptidase
VHVGQRRLVIARVQLGDVTVDRQRSAGQQFVLFEPARKHGDCIDRGPSRSQDVVRRVADHDRAFRRAAGLGENRGKDVGAGLRPGDIVKSRQGLQVEIDNTDAEGRLILADALTKAGESKPELIIDFATLTGAARAALGPDLPALFSNDDELANHLASSGTDVADPIWRMPLWDAYDEMLKSDIADLANAAGGSPMAGAIVAAMFLKRFVPMDSSWAHFDTYAWRDAAKPGRPKGGDALGLRAAFSTVTRRYRSS